MEQKKVIISALQMNSVLNDRSANFVKIEKILAKNLTFPVDIMVLPEVFGGWLVTKILFRKCRKY